LGANVALLKAWKRLLPVAVLLIAAPMALAFSGGICVGCAGGASAPPGEFATFGCTACHGEHLKFAPVSNAGIAVTATTAEGAVLNGPYVAHTTYTLHIAFEETNAPDGGATQHHAGFNLRASAGKLTGVEGMSQASADGKQATHVDAARSSWNVTWEAPDAGAAGFSLFVNDVDGDGSNSEGDQVHWVQFGFTDKEGAVLGAVSEEEVEFGITLQQYWIGLIALVGMIFVMVAGFVYLKFVNPHNTDQKDR
jgi:hypothetical protein